MLSSGDQRAIFYVIESNEQRDCGKLVTFFLQLHVIKVTYSVFQPAMSKKRTILSSSLGQRMEILRSLDEGAIHVLRIKGPFKCYVMQMGVGGCQIFQKKALRRCNVLRGHSSVDIKYMKRKKITYVEYNYSRRPTVQ